MVARQTCVSLTGALAMMAVWHELGAVPGGSSQAPPSCAGSRQPLSMAHWLQRTVVGSEARSRVRRQAMVSPSMLHGAAVGLPQRFGTPPPPQVAGAAHVPQSMVPPQPSGTVPQFWPKEQVVAGTHTHWWFALQE